MDFGLASDAQDPTLTRTGDFVGTLAYAAPEQIRGEPASSRGDVYSLGATLYELLSLRKPFDATSRSELVRSIESADPPALGAEVPADLRTIVECAMARSPGQRFASPEEMAHDLRRFRAGRPILAQPRGLLERALRRVRRHPRVVAAVTLAVLATVLLRGSQELRAAERVRDGRSHLEQTAQMESSLERLLAEVGAAGSTTRRRAWPPTTWGAPT